MSLLDQLETPPPARKSRIAEILLEVTPEEKAALEKALRDPEWPHDALARLLRSTGHGVSEASVRRYRKGLKF